MEGCNFATASEAVARAGPVRRARCNGGSGGRVENVVVAV